jgi:hypothetical protein
MVPVNEMTFKKESSISIMEIVLIFLFKFLPQCATQEFPHAPSAALHRAQTGSI